jgi:hypothetical protein
MNEEKTVEKRIFFFNFYSMKKKTLKKSKKLFWTLLGSEAAVWGFYKERGWAYYFLNVCQFG